MIIGFFIIVFYDKKTYSNINKNKLNESKKFKEAVGLILSAHSLLAITLFIIKWQPLLSFFIFPLAILTFILYFGGFFEAYKEIVKSKRD